MSGTGSVLVVLDGSAQDVATLDWARRAHCPVVITR